jgi:hypothetical protein
VIPQGVYAELRTAHNAYRRLVKERTRIINLVKGLLDGLFPEFTQVFKDPCGLTALSVLSTGSIPGVIAGMTEDEFVATIEAKHRGRLMWKKLMALHYAARLSIGIAAGAKSLSSEISFLVEKLELIRGHICVIERTLVDLPPENDTGYNLTKGGINDQKGIYTGTDHQQATRGRNSLKPRRNHHCNQQEDWGKCPHLLPLAKRVRRYEGRPGSPAQGIGAGELPFKEAGSRSISR